MTPASSQSSPINRSQQKRRAILDAALLEFEAGGFEATSMDQIAARANVSKRTVYNHFGSKEELFETIRGELFGQMARMDCAYDSSKSLSEQLAAIGTQQVELLCSDAFLTFARISIPLSLRSKELAKSTYTEFQASNKAIRGWIGAATDDGRLSVDDASFAVRQFVGLLKAGILWPQLIGGQPTPSKSAKSRVVAATVSMFLNQYAVKP
ncbi:DNA-binding transcriptional repressor AcrR [Maioricimonas rarisocia]|uniref:DNA-binding transcriptional repressor AcrR n=1 Tax=Maioricimonas rarisocia TaxID=2528026 RepID=A0A517ZAS4_9PLAN|nr:TetR/AcrR family transcriptional regulator [Maioricimonas rarisocia]QDU39529.1 DNA-binding transcriptional repressor AcrR [Maioricimonas rarisocia]